MKGLKRGENKEPNNEDDGSPEIRLVRCEETSYTNESQHEADVMRVSIKAMFQVVR